MEQLKLMLRMMDLLEHCIEELDSRTREHIGSDVYSLRVDIVKALESAKNDDELI